MDLNYLTTSSMGKKAKSLKNKVLCCTMQTSKAQQSQVSKQLSWQDMTLKAPGLRPCKDHVDLRKPAGGRWKESKNRERKRMGGGTTKRKRESHQLQHCHAWPQMITPPGQRQPSMPSTVGKQGLSTLGMHFWKHLPPFARFFPCLPPVDLSSFWLASRMSGATGRKWPERGWGCLVCLALPHIHGGNKAGRKRACWTDKWASGTAFSQRIKGQHKACSHIQC